MPFFLLFRQKFPSWCFLEIWSRLDDVGEEGPELSRREIISEVFQLM